MYHAQFHWDFSKLVCHSQRKAMFTAMQLNHSTIAIECNTNLAICLQSKLVNYFLIRQDAILLDRPVQLQKSLKVGLNFPFRV